MGTQLNKTWGWQTYGVCGWNPLPSCSFDIRRKAIVTYFIAFAFELGGAGSISFLSSIMNVGADMLGWGKMDN